ncbi:MAG: Crp/Fnr family transcriptional regulator [Chloroflexota bacterium]
MADSIIERRLDFLRSISLFSELSDGDLEKILADLRSREYKRDDIVFRQGDESRELYIVFKGRVRIYKVSPAGNETSIAIFGPGDIIGEMAAIDPESRSTNVKTLSKVTLLVMAHEAFNQHLQAIPRLSLSMNHLLVQKLRWTAAYAETVAQFDAAGRLLHILLLYNSQFGEEQADADGQTRHVITLDLNQTDLASMVGARREWVNRILRDWRKRNLIEYQNGIVTILDLERVIEERDSRIEANSGGDW